MFIASVYSPYSLGLMSHHYLIVHPSTTDALLPCRHPDSDVIKDKHIFSAQKSKIAHSLAFWAECSLWSTNILIGCTGIIAKIVGFVFIIA